MDDLFPDAHCVIRSAFPDAPVTAQEMDSLKTGVENIKSYAEETEDVDPILFLRFNPEGLKIHTSNTSAEVLKQCGLVQGDVDAIQNLIINFVRENGGKDHDSTGIVFNFESNAAIGECIEKLLEKYPWLKHEDGMEDVAYLAYIIKITPTLFDGMALMTFN